MDYKAIYILTKQDVTIGQQEFTQSPKYS